MNASIIDSIVASFFVRVAERAQRCCMRYLVLFEGRAFVSMPQL